MQLYCLLLKSMQRGRKMQTHWCSSLLLHMFPSFQVYLQCKQSLWRAQGSRQDYEQARPSLDKLHGSIPLCFHKRLKCFICKLIQADNYWKDGVLIHDGGKTTDTQHGNLIENPQPKTVSFIFTFSVAAYTHLILHRATTKRVPDASFQVC